MSASNLLKRFWLTDKFGNLCQSRPVVKDDIVYKKVKTPVLPCFKDKTISYAERLGQVGIDHLAFSIPLRAFQKLRCDEFTKMPDFKGYPFSTTSVNM